MRKAVMLFIKMTDGILAYDPKLFIDRLGDPANCITGKGAIAAGMQFQFFCTEMISVDTSRLYDAPEVAVVVDKPASSYKTNAVVVGKVPFQVMPDLFGDGVELIDLTRLMLDPY